MRVWWLCHEGFAGFVMRVWFCHEGLVDFVLRNLFCFCHEGWMVLS